MALGLHVDEDFGDLGQCSADGVLDPVDQVVRRVRRHLGIDVDGEIDVDGVGPSPGPHVVDLSDARDLPDVLRRKPNLCLNMNFRGQVNHVSIVDWRIAG